MLVCPLAGRLAGVGPGVAPPRIFPELGIHLYVGRVLGQARWVACVRRRRGEVLSVEGGGGGAAAGGVEGEERGEEAERMVGHAASKTNRIHL